MAVARYMSLREKACLCKRIGGRKYANRGRHTEHRCTAHATAANMKFRSLIDSAGMRVLRSIPAGAFRHSHFKMTPHAHGIPGRLAQARIWPPLDMTCLEVQRAVPRHPTTCLKQTGTRTEGLGVLSRFRPPSVVAPCAATCCVEGSGSTCTQFSGMCVPCLGQLVTRVTGNWVENMVEGLVASPAFKEVWAHGCCFVHVLCSAGI